MSRVLRGATILAITALVAKIIGVLYRIPLTNIVGSGGIGLYQMIFPLYVLLLTISSGGLPVAISKVVASRIAVGDEIGAKRVLKLSIISLTSIGFVLALTLFFLRDVIARLQGNDMASLGYMAIAPAIVFVCIIASFRGYFQGRQNMLPSSISQLTEQIIKAGVGIGLAYWLLPRGIEFAVFGALLGVSISEVVTAFILWMQYLYDNKKNMHLKNSSNIGAIISSSQKSRTIIKEIYLIAIPVTLGSLVMPLMGLIDSIIVINLLTNAGTTTATATSYYGILTGPVGTLLNMPTVITLSFAIALLPKISESITKKQNPEKYISQCLKWCIILSFVATAFLAVFASPILSLLYRGGLTADELTLATNLLILGSVSVIFVSILQVATAVLQGAGKPHRPAINLAVGAIFKVVLTIILLPHIGVFGAIIATVVCYAITCLLDVLAMRKIVPLNLNIKKTLLVPLLATATFIAIAIILKLLLAPHVNQILALIISIIIATTVFFAILIVLKALTKEELSLLSAFKKTKPYS